MGFFKSLITNNNTLLLIPLFFPFLILVYIITSSLMNKNIIGIVYLMGYLFTLINNYVFSSISPHKEELTFKSEFCYKGIPLLPPNTSLSSPNMAILIYSLCYFLIPQFLRNIHFVRNPLGFAYYIFENNKELLLFFIFLITCNGYSEIALGCTNEKTSYRKLAIGGFIGFFSAWLYVILFYMTNNKHVLLKNHFLTNKTMCDLPTNRMFRCNKEDSENKIILSNSKQYDTSVDEIVYFGDDELANNKMLRSYNNFNYIHVFGKTSVILFDRDNFRGNKKMILYDNLATEKSVTLITDKPYIIDMEMARKEFNSDTGRNPGANIEINSIQLKKEN